MWRELLPAGSSRAYHVEPPWPQALLPVSNLMTTKHFRNHPGGFISSAGAHALCAGFPPEQIMLQALWPQASWPVWMEKVNKQVIPAAYASIHTAYQTPLWRTHNCWWVFKIQVLAVQVFYCLDPRNNRISNSAVQPIRSPKLFRLRGDSNSPVNYDCTSYKKIKL